MLQADLQQTQKNMTLAQRHKPHTAAAAALFMSQTVWAYSL